MSNHDQLGDQLQAFYLDYVNNYLTVACIAEHNGFEYPGSFSGAGSCYVEFGEGKFGRTDVDFFSSSSPTGIHFEASNLVNQIF